jgi:hypothetical protein
MASVLLWRLPKYDRWGLYLQAVVIGGGLLWWMKKGLVPTVAIGILAFVAVIMTVRDERIKESVVERSVWIVIAFALLIIEVHVTYKDRMESDERQADVLREERQSFTNMIGQERSNFGLQKQTLDLLKQGVAQQTNAASDLVRLLSHKSQAQIEVAQTAKLPDVSLKKRASQLSADIFSFLTERQSGEPKLPVPATREALEKHFADLTSRMNETMALYAQKFTQRVLAIRDDFARQGVRDAELDDWSENPVNPHGLEILAARIGILAERLSQ